MRPSEKSEAKAADQKCLAAGRRASPGVVFSTLTELLIAKGAKVNPKSESGWTPLHSAATQGHKHIAEILLARGADVNAKGW